MRLSPYDLLETVSIRCHYFLRSRLRSVGMQHLDLGRKAAKHPTPIRISCSQLASNALSPSRGPKPQVDQVGQSID